MAATLDQMKAWIAKAEVTASQEVHNFIAWVEQKDNQIESAKAVLVAEGYTVTAPGATPAPAA